MNPPLSPAIARVDRSRPPAPAALRPFTFPAFDRLRLSNGMKVFAARVPGVPLLSIEIITPAGATYDPHGLAGLASLTAALIDEGTAQRSSIEIASAVERLGGYLATGVDWDGAYLATGGLTEHWRATLDLLAEVATEPSFPSEEIERLRRQRLTEIVRRRQVPAAQADRCLERVIYDGTVYEWPLIGTEGSVTTLDRTAITSFYERFYNMADSSLLIVGDFDPEAVLTRAEQSFGRLTAPEPLPQPPEIAPTPPATTTVYIIDRPGAAQTELSVGHAGVARSYPHYAQISLLNAILGGKFTSRINLNLRQRNGFTYGANSRVLPRRGPGPFAVTSAVATPSAGAAAREILFEMRRIRDEEVAQRELEDAQSYAIGVFPYTMQTVGDITKRLETLALFDFANDYFDRYLEQLRSVTRQQIQQAAQSFLHPDRCVVVAVGPADQIAAQFEAVGPVVRWEDPDVMPGGE